MSDLPPIPTWTSDEGRREDARRRPLRPDDVTHAEAIPEPLPSAEAAGSAAGLAAGGGGAQPIGELARAFQANAQALQGVGALQAALIEALKRGDRSELVLASAQGLNESFRQLATIQRAVLARLEAPPVVAQAGSGRLVPLLLLGLAGAVVLATYAIVSTARELIDAQPDPRQLTEHAARLLQEGRDEGARSAEREAQRLQSQVGQGEERVRTLQERLDAERELGVQRQRDLSAKEAELEALRRQAVAAQNEALKMLSLEGEVRQLNTELALSEPRRRELENELELARRDNLRLKKRIAADERGLEDEPAPEEPARPRLAPLTPPPSETPSPAALAGPEAPAPGEAPLGARSGGDVEPTPAPAAAPRAEAASLRDPGLLEQVRGTLNTLLEGASARRPDRWQIMRVDGVTSDRLRGVLAHRYDAQGRHVETVEAREAFFWIERDQRRVVLEFRQGLRNAGGQTGDFSQGSLQSVVADGDALALFAQSGLRQIGSR